MYVFRSWLLTMPAAVCILSLLAGCSSAPRDEKHPAAVPSASPATGLILEESDGERRLQRPPPSGVAALATPFIIKVDRKNGGSPDLVMLYRDVEPGQAIAPHHHPFDGEILFIHRGRGLASLGSREVPVTAGATIYIPPGTRATLRNTGTEPLTTVAIFAKPGFEEYLRDVSVPQGSPRHRSRSRSYPPFARGTGHTWCTTGHRSAIRPAHLRSGGPPTRRGRHPGL